MPALTLLKPTYHEAGKVCYAHAFVILAATSAKLIVRPGADELLEAGSGNLRQAFLG